MSKVKNPVITANEEEVKIKGSKLSIWMTLSCIFDSLKINEIMTKEDLYEAVDLTFMSDEELEKHAKAKALDMLKAFKELIGNKEE